jgi:hypothetical protein
MADPTPTPRTPAGWDRLWVGLILTLPLHLILLILAAAISALVCLATGDREGFCVIAGLVVLAFFGGFQLVYMIPAVLIAFLRGRRFLMQGLIIGAALTFILNAACWGMLAIPNMIGDLLPL